MIVERMQRLHMHDRRPPRAVLGRQHRHAAARLIAIGDRPAAPIGLDRHPLGPQREQLRSEEHTSELQSLMRISYAVFCLKKKNTKQNKQNPIPSKTKNN